MAVFKNEIPILEFDTEQSAVIRPVSPKSRNAFYGRFIGRY